jgi:hypothetical protein
MVEIFNEILKNGVTWKNLFGVTFVLWGLLDAYKYMLEAYKIRQVKTAKGHSRKFINIAITNDMYRIVYFWFFNRDIYLLTSCAFALACMLYLWWVIYIYYPYVTYPRKVYVKRPNLMKYIWNSVLPNKYRPRL